MTLVIALCVLLGLAHVAQKTKFEKRREEIHEQD